MHAKDLLAALRRHPFMPFRLRLSDGAGYEIYHPGMLLVTEHSAHVGTFSLDQPEEEARVRARKMIPHGREIPDQVAIVDLQHITRLEELPGLQLPTITR